MVIRKGFNSRWLEKLHGSLLLLTFAGCGVDRVEDHHELSHTNPPHWPKSLADAHDKLAERFTELRDKGNSQPARREFEEIISWLPEVAADTDLLESEWQAIYDHSEILRLRLAGGAAAEKFETEIEQLLRLIHSSKTF